VRGRRIVNGFAARLRRGLRFTRGVIRRATCATTQSGDAVVIAIDIKGAA
jgi:hypothetical protein